MSKKGEPVSKIEVNLSLRKRKIEMLNAKTKSLQDLKDKS